MSPRQRLALGLCTLIIGIATPTSAHAGSVNHCGSWGDHGDGELDWDDSPVYGAGIFNVRAVKVSCRKARRMARFGIKPSRCNEDFTFCRIGSFTCRSKQSYEFASFFCRNPKERTVRWATGS